MIFNPEEQRMMDLTKALRQSNDAVLLLLAGDCLGCVDGLKEVKETSMMDMEDREDSYFEGAISAFSSSLREIKMLLSNPNNNKTNSTTSEGSIPRESCFSFSSLHTLYDAVSPTDDQQDQGLLKSVSYSFQNISQLHDANDNSSYVYNKMLLFHLFQDDIDMEMEGNSSNSQSCRRTIPPFLSLKDVVHIYSSFIMLNIALAYHQKACRLTIGKDQNKFFNQAEQMYEIVAQKMHSKASIINKAKSTELGTIALLVKAAAINNLSQLQFRRCDYTQSYKGFQFLGSLIFHAVVESTDSPSLQKTRTITEEDENIYRRMLLNVYFLYPPRLAAAA